MMKKMMTLNAMIVVLVLILFTGCSKKTTTEKKYPVKIAETIQRDVPHYLRAIGGLLGSIEVDLKAQVSGILTGVLFIDGTKVEEGDLLMTIDQRPFLADLKSAEAALAQNKARLKYALDFAETYGSLVGKEYVARLDYSQGVQNVDVYKANIEQNLADIDKAKINLGYTEIRAPTRGYIGLRTFDPGNFVDSAQDTILVTLLKVVPLTLNFTLPSEYVLQIREKQKQSPLFVEAYTLGDPIPLMGLVNFISNTVNNASGMIQLQAIIPNEDERGWPGQFVRVQLLLETIPNATLVPTDAIVLGQDGYFVFTLLDDQSVELKSIEKSFEYEDYTVVISGLKPGEKVVTTGQLNLYPGAHAYVPDAENKEAKTELKK